MPKLLLLGGLTTGYHNFAELGPIITRTLEPAGFEVHPTEDLDALSTENLSGYDGLFNFTTDRDISDAQWEALLGFVENGGGYVGIHNATDTFENKPEALRLIGGHFLTHPAQLDIPVEIVDEEHPVTQGVRPFTLHDELYIMEHWPEDYRLLARTEAEGGQPIAWVREQGKGRVFYLSLGHNAHCFDNADYAKLLRRGAQWAVGANVTA
jgi:type 1 glutamine amidotransferase